MPPGTVKENLTFAGGVVGPMPAARKGSAYTCGKLGSTWTAGPIEGDVAGTTYDMDIRISNYKGPGTYGGAELTPGSGVASVFVQITPKGKDAYSMTKPPGGSITIDPGGHSGTLDVQLEGKSGAVHITGSFACPPDF